jgi:hypothetical protein
LAANKSLSGRLAQSDADLLARRDGKLVNVMIKFDVDPVASYQGGVQGIPATSPSASGKTLRENGGAVGAYTAYLGGKFREIRGNISRQVAGVTLGRNFVTAFGGVSARMPANRARDLANVQGVAAVMYDNVRQPQTDATPAFIGADQVWPSLGGSATAGEGVKVGVIDTGIWPEHPPTPTARPPTMATLPAMTAARATQTDTERTPRARPPAAVSRVRFCMASSAGR